MKLSRMLWMGIVMGLIALPTGTQAAGNRLQPGEETVFVIPRLSVPPTIDGAIDAAEWREASAVSGVCDQGSDLLIPRPTTYFFGWDEGHLYFACRTYLRPGWLPRIRDGRSEGVAYCFDEGLELMFKPLGRNVSPQNTQTAFRMFLNCLGYSGDLTRLALGQQMKNWAPAFTVKVRITEPGTAPNGGSWWELEASTVPADFELTGPHRAGDEWLLMPGINHLPMWMQARLPCVGSYFDAPGKCRATLVEQTPGIHFTMDTLRNLASDGTAALTLRGYNPTAKPVDIAIHVDLAGYLVRDRVLSLPAGGDASFVLDEALPEAAHRGKAAIAVTGGGRTLLSYTVYYEAGKHQYMLAPVAPLDPNQFAFIAQYNPVRNQLLVKADSYYLPDPSQAKALRFSLRADGEERPIHAGEIDRVAEWYFQDVIDLPTVPAPGSYLVEATLLLNDGTALGPVTRKIEKKDEAAAFPEWWGKGFGDVERVLPPFTPMTRRRNTIGVWGRDYTLSALGMPEAVTAQGQPLMAAPGRIVVAVNGQEQAVRLGAPKIVESRDWRVRFRGEAEGGGLSFSAEGWVEQDGLVYVELTYAPEGRKPITVDALRLEFPLAGADAESLVCVGPGNNFASKTTMLLPPEQQGQLWSTLVTGRTGSNMKVGSFYPSVWIGSERRGFLWWADNDRGWFPDDAVAAHDAIREGGAVILRNHLIGKPVTLDRPRTVAFSYMASPFKPLPDGWRMFAATEDGTFFQPHRSVRKDSRTGEKLWDAKRGNINWIHPESRYPEEWPALWAEQKQAADASLASRLPYDPFAARGGITWQHMSFQLIGYGHKSILKDIYAYFGDEWFPGGHDTWNPTYTDYAMYLFDRAFREGGVASTYWDLTFPILYDSLLSGLCYRLPDGRVQPGYNGWNVRRFFMRLWALQAEYGLNPGAVGSHSTNAYVFVALPWLDAVLDGERDWHLDTSDHDWIDYYPIERMRSMSMPHNWGVGLCWMSNYTSADPAKVKAAKTRQAEYLWMHDSWRNPYLAPGPIRMPDAILDWGLTAPDVAYHPYWRNPLVTTRARDILVSSWVLPDRVLIGLFNYHRAETRDVVLNLDLPALGLVPQRRWQEFVAIRDLYKPDEAMPPAKLDYHQGTVTVNRLPPHTGRFVAIRRY